MNNLDKQKLLCKGLEQYEGPYVIPRQEDMHVHVCACGQMATTRFMTGQEWYDRFEQEWPSWSGFISKEYNDGYADSRMKALEAAKKAAGLE